MEFQSQVLKYQRNHDLPVRELADRSQRPLRPDGHLPSSGEELKKDVAPKQGRSCREEFLPSRGEELQGRVSPLVRGGVFLSRCRGTAKVHGAQVRRKFCATQVLDNQ